VETDPTAAANGDCKTLDERLELITEEAYAAFAGKTIPSLRNDRHLGRGPPFTKLGKTIKYPIAGIREYVEKNTRTPGAAAERAPTLIESGLPKRARRGEAGKGINTADAKAPRRTKSKMTGG